MKRRLLKILIFLFIFLAVSSTASFSIINSVALKNIDKEVEKNYESIVQELANNISHIIGNAQDLTVNIKEANSIKEILLKDGEYKKTDDYTFVLAKQELKNYKSYNSFISGQYVYYPVENRIVTSVGTFSPEVAFQHIHAQDIKYYSRWLSIINKKYNVGEIVSIGENAVYIESLTNAKNKNYANIIVLFNGQRFQEMFDDNFLFQVGEVYLANKKGEVLYTNTKDGLKTIDLGIYSFQKEVPTTQINKDKVISSVEREGIYYIAQVPTKVLYKNKNIIIKISIFFIFIVGLYLLIAIYFIYKKYEVIMNIIRQLSFSGEEDSVYGEIEYIETIVAHMKKRVRSEKSIAIENTFRKALDGVVNHDEMIEKEIKESLELDSYVVIYIKSLGQEKENNKLLEFIIQNVCKETLGEGYDIYILDCYKGYILVVNFKKLEEEYMYEEIMHRLEIARKFMEEKIGISFVLAVSNMHRHLNELSKAYAETMEAWEYRMFFEKEKMIAFERIDKEEGPSLYDIKQEIELARYIKNGEFEQAIKYLQSIFELHFVKQIPSVKNTKEFIRQLTTSLENICYEFNIKKIEKFENNLIGKNIGDIEKCFEEYIQMIGNKLNKNKVEEYNEKIQAILAYVEKNYCNDNLTVGLISEEFNMKVSYLSRFFKEHTQENLLQYINKLRIEKAKELLCKTNLNLNEIADQVGLLNNAALIRCFKKFEFITPNEYRTNNKK